MAAVEFIHHDCQVTSPEQLGLDIFLYIIKY